VKVGRAALDEEAIRLLEEFNPEVEFDWTRILKGGTPVDESRPPAPFGRRSTDRSRRPESRRRDERRTSQPAAKLPAKTAVSPYAEPEAGDRRASVPARESEVPEGRDEPPVPQVAPPTAAHAQLGSEGVSRLRGRYAEVLARINERVMDESRREELKGLAERLNPDSWVTEAEVAAGLEEYEGVFESLRAVVGRRKRRRRRGARTKGQGPGGQGAAPESSTGDTASQQEAPGPDEEPDAEDL
jgi:hypothetical protein